MKNILAALFACFLAFSPVQAQELSGEFNGVSVTLYKTECVTPAIVDFLKPEFLKFFKQGQGAENGKGFALCYADDPEFLKFLEVPQDHIFVIDEHFRLGGLPVAIFAQESPNRI